MERRKIEFLWAWLDALRRGDSATMIAALDPEVVWQGVRPDLVCNGPEEVAAGFASGYDANQEIITIEIFGTDRKLVLGVRGHDLGEIEDLEVNEIYNVFTIEDEKITRIDDYLRRDEALAATGLG